MYIKIYYNLFYVFMLSSFLSCISINIFWFIFLHEDFREDIGVTQSCPFLLSYLQDLDLQIVDEGVEHCLCF